MRKELFVTLLVGCLLAVSSFCKANQTNHPSEAANRVNMKLSLLELKADESLHFSSDPFQNNPLYFQLPSKGGNVPLDKQSMISTGHYREKLREFLTVHFNDNIQIGIDRIKVSPISAQRSEILQVGSYLQTRGSGGKTAQGYGLELKVTLD